MRTIDCISRQIRDGVLAVTFVLILTGFCRAQFRTVTVQNAPANPVPTTIQNTPSVTVSGTPDVNATISGTPNVNVANTPTVTVGNTTAAPVPVVGSGNVAAAPVIIRNNDEPARQPFQATCSVSVTTAGSVSCMVTTVPAGKELVIEAVTSNFTILTTDSLVAVELVTKAGPVPFGIAHEFVPTYMTNEGSSNAYSLHQMTRLYADSSTQVTGRLYVLGGSSGFTRAAYFTISGYLVSVP